VSRGWWRPPITGPRSAPAQAVIIGYGTGSCPRAADGPLAEDVLADLAPPSRSAPRCSRCCCSPSARRCCPPLDAARLDVIPAGVWGRSEAIRTTVRTLGESAAPPLFGYLSADTFGGRDGLEHAFLICTVPLTAAGALTFLSLRTYPRDIATALASGQPPPR
jgi:hypothetical protein